MQAVLSAASKRNQLAAQRTRGGDKPAESVAYIPVPDSTGLVDNYDELYPPGRWKDPITYVATSATVEECCKNALSNGFTYYMDERDKEWLDKNNEEARGEGTSTQGAVSASASGATRVSARSAKAKGKEPESSQPHVISEDSFELVMGIFEKVTHEKTEHLHLVSQPPTFTITSTNIILVTEYWHGFPRIHRISRNVCVTHASFIFCYFCSPDGHTTSRFTCATCAIDLSTLEGETFGARRSSDYSCSSCNCVFLLNV